MGESQYLEYNHVCDYSDHDLDTTHQNQSEKKLNHDGLKVR